MKRQGFTLAEVLTTLMVIGVVAAMTIPTLMNSTKDQQDKVAYKKAMSVLGQGIQLLQAKEEECIVQSSRDLASCFAAYVLAGTQGVKSTDEKGTEHTNENVILTSDGMAYAFYYAAGKDSNGNAIDATKLTGYRPLYDICGQTLTPTIMSDYNGSISSCIVIVDTNGLNKGSKYFMNDGTSYSLGAASNLIGGSSDQFPFIITGNGVIPVYDSSVAKDSNGKNTGINKGYGWVYGGTAEPLSKPISLPKS